MEGTFKELIQFIKTVSPEVWQVLMKQVYVEVASGIAWATLWISFAIMSYKVKDRWEAIEDNKWVAWIAIIAFGVIAFGLLVSSTMWLINPEFYAIRWLVREVIP